ncbi:MAG: hypothetical protein P0Y53_01225 [Candidatus Pseudobacter hemicellulosilyticus]|uniref:Uncharacterized protein n=1 Tax=Candidatus Pseudobacter hemicellulosilyticus TaxID=3121375 RepID=A0AAJ6BHP4_9BACT|nr:MAG: hypothetical protein P0Y53_01225 [Pseudobacter sp.]
MERELPEFDIMGYVFQVDVYSSCFRMKHYPNTQLSIFNMDLLENGYGFEFKKSSGALINYSGSEYVTVNWLAHYDPQTMSEKYDKPLDEVIGKSDFDIIVDKDALNRMLKGKHVRVDILGEQYELDGDYLRPLRKSIDSGIDLSNDYGPLEGIVVPYDPILKVVPELDHDTITAVPEGIVYIDIPPLAVLDPVTYSREWNLNLKLTAMQFPPKLLHIAKEVGVEESGVLTSIEINKKRMAKKAKKSKGRKPKR